MADYYYEARKHDKWLRKHAKENKVILRWMGNATTQITMGTYLIGLRAVGEVPESNKEIQEATCISIRQTSRRLRPCFAYFACYHFPGI